MRTLLGKGHVIADVNSQDASKKPLPLHGESCGRKGNIKVSLHLKLLNL